MTKILPYVYKLTHKESGQFYIGYRKANKVQSGYDIGIVYFSSSPRVKELGFENFNIEIIAEFFDWKEANLFEQGLIKENFKNPLCLNKNYSINGSIRFTTYGYTHREDTKKKISLANIGANNPMFNKESRFKGKSHNESAKLSISDNRKGKCVGSNHPKSKKVLVNGVIYETITQAAVSIGYSVSHISTILKTGSINKNIWEAEYLLLL